MSTYTDRVRALNDQFRRGFDRRLGQVVTTSGVASLGPQFCGEAVQLVRRFDGFTPGNDPHGEHDFAASPIAVTRFSGRSTVTIQALSGVRSKATIQGKAGAY